MNIDLKTCNGQFSIHIKKLIFQFSGKTEKRLATLYMDPD